MGKKSKHKSNKPTSCYHGCTKKEFNNCGEHLKVLEELTQTANETEFNEKYDRVLLDAKFGRFLIAHIADDYLTGKDDGILHHRLLLLLGIRYDGIPSHEGKDVGPESEYTRNYYKYCRDITTERGRINCIVREMDIPCDCMAEKRIEAKSMEKVALCWCCRKEFSKKKILRCIGCDYVQYCSKECSIKAWPEHKAMCREYSGLSAPTQAPTPGS